MNETSMAVSGAGLPASRRPADEVLIRGAIPNATTFSWRTPRTEHRVMNLEAVRDGLRHQKMQDAPEDYERTPGTSILRFRRRGQGAHEMQIMHAQGMGEPMSISRHALSQYASRILPARGLGYMDRLAELGLDVDMDAGTKLATTNWALFAKHHPDPLMFRTVVRGGRRMVRATLTQGYSTYDNLQFVEDVMAALGPAVARIGVVDFRVDDDAMRLRLVLDAETWKQKEVGVPHPMVELWDSEVGSRAVYVRSGTFVLRCSNGMGHWDDKATWRWNHAGGVSQRIRNGVVGAVNEAAMKANGMVAAYEQALDTAINDAFMWFEQQAEGLGVTDAQVGVVGNALRNDPLVLEHAGTLAGLVDAITSVAQLESDLFGTEALERVGGVLLRRGIEQSGSERRIVAQPRV